MAAELSNAIASHANLDKFSTFRYTKIDKCRLVGILKTVGKNPRLKEFMVERNEQIDPISIGSIAQNCRNQKCYKALRFLRNTFK